MERVRSVVTSFAEEAQLLLTIAANLGHYRQQQNWEDFQRSLLALGMPAAEIGRYWAAIDVAPSGNGAAINPARLDWTTIRRNTDLSRRLGIDLDSNQHPRNLLLYRLMELHFAEFFEVKVTGTTHMGGKMGKGNPPGCRRVHFPKSPVQATESGDVTPLSVHRVLRGIEPSLFSERVLRIARPLIEAFGKELGKQLAEVLLQCKMLIPPLAMSRRLSQVLHAGMSGEPIVVVGAFCPDYAYEETDDPHLPYRYTFDGVGEGVGLVAQQFVRIVPEISYLLRELGIEHRLVLGIGDFEADSEAVLARVGLDRAEFLRRCQCSLAAFGSSLPTGLPVELEMCGEDRCRKRLRPYAQEAITAMLQGNYGHMAELHENLSTIMARIPGQYRTFYERWYGHTMTDPEVNQIVYEQGGEYAALARIYQEDLGDNVIILAGDRPEMHRFNAFYSLAPTLCAKRAY